MAIGDELTQGVDVLVVHLLNAGGLEWVLLRAADCSIRTFFVLVRFI